MPASVTFVSAADGWFLGTAPCGRPPCTSVVRTGDAGRSWVGIPAPRLPLGDGGVGELRFADPRDGFAFGDVLAVTHDAGAHWHRVDLPVLTHGRVAALAADAGSVYAFVVPAPGRTGFGVLYRSPVCHDDFSPVPGTRVDGVTSAQLVLADTTGWLAVATPSTAEVLGTDGNAGPRGQVRAPAGSAGRRCSPRLEVAP